MLKDQVIIVTGASKGIGLSCVRKITSLGAKVIMADIDEAAGEKAEQELITNEASVKFVHANVAERLDVKNLIAASLDIYGRIDGLVNNAGIIHTAEFLEVKEEDFDRVLSVNLKGAFLMGQAVAKQMVAQREGDQEVEINAHLRSHGAIVNMSSVNAVFAIANQVPYTVSKGGLNQLTKVMALSLAPYNIRVNGVGPGSIKTEILEAVMEDQSAQHKILSRTPIGRIGEPEEIANVVAFLLSDEASYMTGQTLYADGGRLGLNYTVPVE